ncbi:hypothetical protein KI387_012786 [Taxus chinensis]|uniref:mitogen-activated protein kinase kinase kinase n=1 Tax=Taxus chinensis TaxID=29808 RepID=A0AA38CRJ5_TAXCH|nr:hypothetical protein KI387_012786 [Taxus chinensis]
MNYLKTYFNRNKKVSPSSKHPLSPNSPYSDQNGSHFLFSPQYLPDGDYSSKESQNSAHSNWKYSSKSSPLPMGNTTPSRLGLVGSAKVIQTLGAESLEEAMDILTLMQRPSLATDSFQSCGLLEECDEVEACEPNLSPASSQFFAMIASYKPAVCKVYEPGHAPTGHLTSYVSYPENVLDPPRYSFDGFPSNHCVSARQEQSRCAPRRNSVSWDSVSGAGSSSSDYKSIYDSPQLSPHVANYQAHPLPTPPSSPSKLSRKIMPKKLPLPPPAKLSDKELETNQRSLRMNTCRMHLSSQSTVSPRQCPKNWTKGKVLGKGSFGTVYEGLNLDDGSFFAVKISDVETAAPEVRQEIDVLRRLNHPNIVRYLGSSLDEGHLCIFLELVGMGSLRRVLDKYKHFEENMIRTYTRQILWGLEYLHQQNTIHRDLKCANILVHPDGQVKLADFGVAKQMSLSLADSCKGTPLYMAPEMMKSSIENRKYGLAVDIWSLGCTIIEMANGKPPWSDLEGFSFFFKLGRGELPPIPEHLSLEAKNFLRKCLKVNPEERANVSELLQHPFVADAPAIAPPFSPHISSQRQYL